MKTQKATALMAILFIPAIWACSDSLVSPEEQQEGAPASASTQDPYLTISPGVLNLGLGEEGHFSARYVHHQTQGTAQTEVRWMSLDPQIASVDADGNVLALARGMARIRAEADDFLDEAWVRVR